jgi:hypothetical protein
MKHISALALLLAIVCCIGGAVGSLVEISEDQVRELRGGGGGGSAQNETTTPEPEPPSCIDTVLTASSGEFKSTRAHRPSGHLCFTWLIAPSYPGPFIIELVFTKFDVSDLMILDGNASATDGWSLSGVTPTYLSLPTVHSTGKMLFITFDPHSFDWFFATFRVRIVTGTKSSPKARARSAAGRTGATPTHIATGCWSLLALQPCAWISPAWTQARGVGCVCTMAST